MHVDLGELSVAQVFRQRGQSRLETEATKKFAINKEAVKILIQATRT